ncbi:MAG: glycosyl hydrolase family 18 protein, partial [Betaproteobacteria bacterium]
MIRSVSALRSRQAASAIAAAVLLAGLMPGASVVASPGAGVALGPSVARGTPTAADSSRSGAGAGTMSGRTTVDDVGRPDTSIVYEQAMEHANDRITFTPGGRVSTPFVPRVTDTWPVGGKAPTRLPAGRASGSEMARSPQGSAWTPMASSPVPGSTGASGSSYTYPVDGPGGGSAIAAAGAGWTANPASGAADPAVAAGLRRQVFGFLPYWEVSGAASSLNYDDLSTIAYFSVGADSNGNLQKQTSTGSATTGWAGWTSSSLTSVISAAHTRGTRVVLTISVFAWTTGGASVQAALLGSATARQNLATQAVAAVRDRGADGINLDFEPLVTGYEDEFVALLKTIRSQLDAVAPGYQLTYDTTGWIGNYPIEASVAPGAADAIFIMGYDYRTASSSYAGSIDPLSGPVYDLTDTIREYTARVSPSQVILGLPWYGRAWSTTTAALHAPNQSGEKYGYSTAVNYENIPALVAQYGRQWDSTEQTPWFVYQRQNCTATYGCVTSWRQVYYDDAQSMGLRLGMVNTYGLRGAGIWALGYNGGYPELYTAISDAFLVDTTGPVTGVRMLAATQPDEGFTVSWAGTDASGVASYDVQVSTDGGPWADWLAGTTATSAIWLGQDGHGYAFRTRGRDVKGNVATWNVTSVWTASPTLAVGGFGQVLGDGLSYRTGPDTSAAKLGTIGAGTVVAITGGPVTADGYTWWQVTQPIQEWSPVSFAEVGVWLASGPSATPTDYVAPFRAPNSTTVAAGIRGLGFNGLGASSIGPANAATRFVSPNGDGDRDTVQLDWETTVSLATLQLRVYRADGTLVDTRTLTPGAPGAGHYAWDAKAGGVAVPDGTYVLQLVGTSGSTTYTAPSANPVTPAQLTAYGVTVNHLPVSRLYGQTLYDTSAAISAASFSPGVPVVYIATGTRFPDALTG